MKYSDLIEYMHKFRLGKIDHDAMAVIIHLWQRSKGFKVEESFIDKFGKYLRKEIPKILQIPEKILFPWT